jgi:hypothetical protein
VVFSQEFPVDARLVVEAFRVRPRREHRQVAVSSLVAGQQDQVVVLIAALGARLVPARSPGYVEFAADYGVDAGLLAFLVEFQGAEHVAVVGDGQAGHTEL